MPFRFTLRDNLDWGRAFDNRCREIGSSIFRDFKPNLYVETNEWQKGAFMRVVSKSLKLSAILTLVICMAGNRVDCQNNQNRPFDYQKYSNSVKQLEMKIGVTHKQWKTSEPIIVSAYLLNRGKNSVRIPDPGVTWYRYKISVIGQNNQQVPMAEFTKDGLKWGAVSSGAREIKPGETIEEKVHISEIFKLNQKGTYRIIFKRQVGVADKVRHELSSNTITISVVE